MTDGKQLVERRKHERFKAGDGALAVLRRSWPHPTTLGQIIDISMGGLAFRCIADEERSDRSSEPQKRAHSPQVLPDASASRAAGLASASENGTLPYGRREALPSGRTFAAACCGELQLSIMLADSSFYLHKLPIKPVSDFETAKMPSGCMTPRRCRVQFEELTDKQGSQLKYFIRNHTTGEAWVNDSAYVIPFIEGSINALLVSGMMWGLIILVGYYLFR